MVHPAFTVAEAAPSPPLDPRAISPAPNRIEAQAYVFLRPGSGRALASGSALGGSQAAARIAVPFGGHFAAAARLYAPLASRGAEAALGFDWRPVTGLPLRFSIERRQRLDAEGRSAWSAYAAGGFYTAPVPNLILDGYAQAGFVGARRRDLFADGALRVERRVMSGPIAVGVGGGLWGAAQPGAARLDAGPRVSVRLPLADHAVTLAVEERFRLAGNARPGSGAALTLAAGL